MLKVKRTMVRICKKNHSCLSAGNFTRFGYDKETETCEEFNYGGCKGDIRNIHVTYIFSYF